MSENILLFYEESPYDFDPEYSNRTMSGFYAWRYLLEKSLLKLGYDVHMNNRELAVANPRYPVGIIGHPQILQNWDLPNPAVLGPSLYDHPKLNPKLMEDERFSYYLVTCEWFKSLFIPFYGDSCVSWFAGIDLDEWGDTQAVNPKKTIDILIYDKIRWERQKQINNVLHPILENLETRQISYHILRYSNYSHREYKSLLLSSRAMLFLCEHETQGMGYQEALASNVPVIAWDPGYWSAPQREEFEEYPIPATSVPYFSDACGKTFRAVNEFPASFDSFWRNLFSYQPRKFIENNLSLEQSGKLYLNYYFSLL